HGCTARSPPRAAQGGSLPPARLCRQHQGQHFRRAAKMEEVHDPRLSRLSVISLTNTEDTANPASCPGRGETSSRRRTERWRWISSSICVKHTRSSRGAHHGNIFASTTVSYTPASRAVTWTGTTAEKSSRYV